MKLTVVTGWQPETSFIGDIMKIERIEAKKQQSFAQFVSTHLPHTLAVRGRFLSKDIEVGAIRKKIRTRMVPISCGYGQSYKCEESTTFEKIAVISGNHLELFYPEYFSDFEQIIENYERASGQEIIFRYWES